MKKKNILSAASIFIIGALLLSGCAGSGNTADKVNSVKSANNSGSVNSSASVKKDAKSITDSDLLNSSGQDSSVQLDSVDDQQQSLSSDELDSLLNDNSDLNNISSSFNVK